MAFGKRKIFAPFDTPATMEKIEENITPISFRIIIMSVTMLVPIAVLIMIFKIITS
jgi:hypothetical protein